MAGTDCDQRVPALLPQGGEAVTLWWVVHQISLTLATVNQLCLLMLNSSLLAHQVMIEEEW